MLTGAVRGAVSAAARRGIRPLRAAWRAKPVPVRGEYAMGLNRLLIGAAVFVATAADAAGGGDLAFPHWAPVIGTWIALAGLVLVHLVSRPRPCAVRRVCALVLDVAGASVLLHATDAAGAFAYPIYSWIIVGHGVRFGAGHLIAAAASSVAGFGLVAATTPYWQAQPRLAAGLLVGLVVVPLYLQLLLRHLAAARAAAERADRAKTLFLAGVSHELRTPLNAIVGTVSMLQTTGLDRDQARALATLDAAAEVLDGMIGGLLDVSRIEAGQPRPTPETFDLARLIAQVGAVMRVQAERKGLRFNAFVDAGTPLDLHGDAAHLRDILLGLCGNAVKFTRAGSVAVAVRTEAGEAGGLFLRAEVSDTGIGIPPEAQGHIFGMFAQADATIARRFGGTGVGLAVCERLVRLLGGRIGVASEPGRGSTFWFTVPVRVRAEASSPPALDEPVCVVADDPRDGAAWVERLRACGVEARSRPAEPRMHRPAALAFVVPSRAAARPGGAHEGQVEVLALPDDARGRHGWPPAAVRRRYATAVAATDADATFRRAARIAAAHLPATPHPSPPPETRGERPTVRVLVADDNPVNRNVLAGVLRHAGHEVVAAEDGRQACEALASVDAAFLDVNMPVLSGIDAARVHAAAGGRVPIIGLTADGTPQTTARCLAAGMVACLVKPVRPPALLDALDGALATREEERMEHPGSVPRPQARAPTPTPAPATPALDPCMLADLAGIGGETFVARVVRDFVAEAERLIGDLRAASHAADPPGIRMHAHEICSCAANVGAVALHDLCSPWQAMSDAELEHAGPGLLQHLDAVWSRTRAALLERAARDPSRAPGPAAHGARGPEPHGPAREAVTPPGTLDARGLARR